MNERHRFLVGALLSSLVLGGLFTDLFSPVESVLESLGLDPFASAVFFGLSGGSVLWGMAVGVLLSLLGWRILVEE